MGRRETLAPARPLLKLAAISGYLDLLRRTLAALEAQIPEAALASALGEPDGKAKLAALAEKIRNVTFEMENHGKALELATIHDHETIRAFKARVQNLPIETILEGLTRESCPLRCLEVGCAISGSDPAGGPCCHPVLVGPLELHRYEASPTIKKIYRAACEKLNVRIKA